MLIFLSHSWHDKPVVFQLAEALRRMGPSVDVWHDCENLQLGESILDSVEAAIDQADLVAVIWTPEAAASEGVAHEITYAASAPSRLVPITVARPDGTTQPFSPSFGRLPLVLELSSEPTDEEIDMAAAGLLELVVQQLAADEGLPLKRRQAGQKKIRSLGVTLRHLLNRSDDSSVRRQKARWIDVLRTNRFSTMQAAEEELHMLSTSMNLLEQVVDAVERRPTDRGSLLSLREAAQDLMDHDPSAAGQAITVIDMRLAEPLR